MRILLLALTLAAFAPAVSTAAAQSSVETALEEGEPRIRVSLVADRDGDALRVGVHFQPDPHWHVYWKNPGESGVSTEVVLEGARFGEIQWPIPQRYEAPGPIYTYGYDEVVLFAETPAPEAPIDVRADVDFLVCEIDCIPARVELAATIEPDASHDALRRFAQQVPVPGEVELVGTWPDAGETTLAEIACAGCALDHERVFFERASVGVRTLPGESEGSVRVELAARSAEAPSPLRGVLEARVGDELRHIAFEAALTPPEQPLVSLATSTAPPSISIGVALLFALLGGLLLNLMPCVLPVLTVKVLGMLRLAGAPRAARKHGWAYALGVVGSMVALAAVVLVFRAAGTELGWGFHLQEPRFVAAMVILLVVLALGFFGVVHFRVSTVRLGEQVDASAGLRRSVGEGVLAVILATPCTAPFLGSAVGFALTQPAWVIVATFAAVGIGLAAPFVLLVHAPALLKRMPKPGAWMEALERLLGFALLGTAVWLTWVYGQTMGVDGVAILLGATLAIAIGVWAFGRWPGWRAAGFAMVMVGAGAAALSMLAPVGSVATHAEWRAWDPDAVRAEVANGRRAMVVFTADWCVTCKVNERFVLRSDEVREQLRDVAVFVADWTARDDRIREELSRHARAGVPLTLLYRPRAPDSPEILPELLTTEIVLDALRRAEG